MVDGRFDEARRRHQGAKLAWASYHLEEGQTELALELVREAREAGPLPERLEALAQEIERRATETESE